MEETPVPRRYLMGVSSVPVTDCDRPDAESPEPTAVDDAVESEQ